MAEPAPNPALLALRERIDAVDLELLALLNRRARLAQEVGDLFLSMAKGSRLLPFAKQQHRLVSEAYDLEVVRLIEGVLVVGPPDGSFEVHIYRVKLHSWASDEVRLLDEVLERYLVGFDIFAADL